MLQKNSVQCTEVNGTLCTDPEELCAGSRSQRDALTSCRSVLSSAGSFSWGRGAPLRWASGWGQGGVLALWGVGSPHSSSLLGEDGGVRCGGRRCCNPLPCSRSFLSRAQKSTVRSPQLQRNSGKGTEVNGTLCTCTESFCVGHKGQRYALQCSRSFLCRAQKSTEPSYQLQKLPWVG